jgi:hypothetical protein
MRITVDRAHLRRAGDGGHGGKREIHARHQGLVPFVALKVVKDPDREKP